MDYNIPINQWVSVLKWRPSNHVSSIFIKFLDYHIRPTQEVSLAHIMDCGDVIISPYQVSLIIGLRANYFECLSVKSKHLDNQARYLASELDVYQNLGQTVKWNLDASNFLMGNWEVFNGPNPINLTAHPL